MENAIQCPTQETIKQLLAGTLREPFASDVESHVLGCLPCQQFLAASTSEAGLNNLQAAARVLQEESPRLKQLLEFCGSIDRLVAFRQNDGTLSYVGQDTSAGGRFRVLRPHAEGGIGRVFVAHDEELNREVALKEIKQRFADDSETRNRFIREAEITGGMEHPGIVPVYGVGEHPDGRPFYVMRFIRGDSLKDAIERFHRGSSNPFADTTKQLELRKLLQRFIDVCEAMEYAHSRGVLHRDLKPGNIMLGKYGETLIVDWGLAKALGGQGLDAKQSSSLNAETPLQPRSGDSTAPTIMGATVGTPAFMPPEQAAGRLDLLGPASDVYSLGATLYALLTAKTPVAGDNSGEILAKVRRGEIIPPREVNSTIPKPLEAICLRALSLEGADRYASAQALADDLERWLADEPVHVYREPLSQRVGRTLRRHRTLAASVFAALVMGVFGLAGLAFFAELANGRLNQVNEKLNIANADLEASNTKLESANTALAATNEKVAEVNQNLTAAISRESQATAAAKDNLYTAHMNLVHQAWERAEVEKVQDLLVRHIPQPGEPDRRSFEWFYYWNELHSEYATLEGFPGPVHALSYSQDGRWLAVASEVNNASAGMSGAIFVWEIGTREPPRMLAKFPQIPYALAFQPEGDWLAHTSGDKRTIGEVTLRNVVTGETKKLAGHTQPVLAIAFTPDGKRLATAGQDNSDPFKTGFPECKRGLIGFGGNRPGEVKLWTVATAEEIVPERPADFRNRGITALAFSHDGELLLGGTEKGELLAWTAAGKSLWQHSSDGTYTPVQSLSSSPDQARVLVGTGSTQLGGRAYQYFFNRQEVTANRPVDTPRGGVLKCLYSPNGEWMAVAGLDRTVRIWQYATGRFQEYCVIRGHTEAVQALAFSPDNRFLATGGWDGKVKFWALCRPPGWAAFRAADSGGRYGFVRIGGDPERLFSISSHTGEVKTFDAISLEEVSPPCRGSVVIAHDGRPYLVTYGAEESKAELRCMDALDSPPEAVMTLDPGEGNFQVCASPNLQWLLCAGEKDRTLTMRVREIATGKLVAERSYKYGGAPDKKFLSGAPSMQQFCISPDSTRLAQHNQAHQLCLWSLPDLGEIKSRFFPGDHPRALDFSMDGKLLATGSEEGVVQLWDSQSLELIHTFPVTTPITVFGLRFSPDSRLLAAGTRDGGIRLLDVATYEERLMLHGYPGSLLDLTFSRNGRTLFAEYVGPTCALFGLDPQLSEAPAPLGNSGGPRFISGNFQVAPRRWAQWHRQRAISAMYAGETRSALLHARQAAETLPDNTEANEDSEFQHAVGVALHRNKKYDEAAVKLRRASELPNERPYHIWVNLARNALHRRDEELFREALPKACDYLSKQPVHPSWKLHLIESAVLLPDAVADWTPLKELSAGCLKEAPNFEAERAAGLIDLRCAEFQSAIRHLTEALELRPQSLSTQFALAIARHRAEQPDRAAYQKASESLAETKATDTPDGVSDWKQLDDFGRLTIERLAAEAESLYEEE